MPIETIDRGTAGDTGDKFRAGVAFDTCQANDNFLDAKIDTLDADLIVDLALKANISSPIFTDNPRAPTPTVGDNDTSIATTAFVQSEFSAREIVIGPASSTANAIALFDGTSGVLLKDGPLPTTIGTAFVTVANPGAVTFPRANADNSLTLRSAADLKTDLSLNNVDNTSDANKPVSIAQQAALDLKVTGPASVTDSVVALFDGITGKLIKAGTSMSDYLDAFLVTLYNIFPRKVATFSDFTTTPAIVGQVFKLVSRTSDGIGGGDFLAYAATHAATDGGLFINTATAGIRVKRLYTDLHLEYFGLLESSSDNGPAFALAIAAAAGRELKETRGGTFIVTTAIGYDTTGLGYVDGLKISGAGKHKTIFDNRCSGPLISLTSGNSSSDFQYNANLNNFSITNSQAQALTYGISMTGVFNSFIKSVSVTDQGKFGVYLFSTIGDATDCYNIEIDNCTLNDNGYSGIRVYATTAINANIRITNNTILGNTLGGIEMYSIVSSKITGNAIAYNLLFGVYIGRDTGGNYSKIIEISNNEYDSNEGIQCEFDYVTGVEEHNNYYVVNNSSPVVTELVRITANVINVTCQLASPRIPVSYTGVTAYYVEAGATLVRIQNPTWSSWQTSGNTKYNNLATDAIIIDTNAFETPALVNAGIKFPAVQVSSSNANTLDDYKESTWAATVDSATNFTGTPTFSGGAYTKNGNIVVINGLFSGTVTATAAASITFQLPFLCKTAPSYSIGNALEMSTLVSGTIYDPSSGSDNTMVLYFSSVTSGARTFRAQLTYLSV